MELTAWLQRLMEENAAGPRLFGVTCTAADSGNDFSSETQHMCWHKRLAYFYEANLCCCFFFHFFLNNIQQFNNNTNNK